MTDVMRPHPRATPDWLVTLAAARDAYAEWRGWPVDLDVTGRKLVMVLSASMGAVTVPSPLAERLTEELRTAMSAGPVIADPSGPWTFFVRPQDAGLVPDDLANAGVELIGSGGQVAVPAEIGPNDRRHWAVAPGHHVRIPPCTTVFDMARRVVARSGTHRAA